MKITVYTITDCKFSQQERDYLKTNNLTFEEKNLESNKEFLTEMLAISNNFAGTPVTKIEKDDGQIVVLKGFTKEEFDRALGLATAPASTESVEKTAPATSEPTPVVVPTPPSPPTPPPAAPEPVTPDPLKTVLQDLEAKSQEPTTPTPAAPTTPNIPNFQDK